MLPLIFIRGQFTLGFLLLEINWNCWLLYLLCYTLVTGSQHMQVKCSLNERSGLFENNNSTLVKKKSHKEYSKRGKITQYENVSTFLIK